MLNLIKKIIPKRVKKPIKDYHYKMFVKKNFKYDREKYLKYSFEYGDTKTQRHHEADLIFYYHKIEKGLSLASPRVGFGNKAIEELVQKLEYYTKTYGWDNISLISLNALYEYYKFNKKNNVELAELFEKLENLKRTINNVNHQVSVGGVDEIYRKDVAKMSNINFKDFAYSRYSIRNFEPGEVSLDLINEAVYIAQKTPTVCNRQSARIYVYTEDKIKREILKYQNGNAGFGEDADKIIIITTDLRDFRGVIERNQCFIDGGLYSMSMLYALHSLGVGTCPLNLCLTYDMEKKLKEVAKINDFEALITMIAVGNIPDKLKVASSARRKVDEVLRVY